jgi:hypothetical protein
VLALDWSEILGSSPSTSTKIGENMDIQYYVGLIKKYWLQFEPDFVSIITEIRGWNPLQVDEKMTVTFGDKRYTVERID